MLDSITSRGTTSSLPASSLLKNSFTARIRCSRPRTRRSQSEAGTMRGSICRMGLVTFNIPKEYCSSSSNPCARRSFSHFPGPVRLNSSRTRS